MAITFSSTDGNSVDDGTSFISIDGSQTTGQFGVVCVGISQTPNAATVSSITDTASSVWTFRAGVTNSTGSVRTEVWTCSSMLGAGVTVTVNLSAVTDAHGSFLYYDGVVGVGTTNTNTGASTTPTVSLTTQDTNNYVVAALAYQNATARTITQLTGTLRESSDISGTLLVGAGGVDNTAASASSVTCAITLGSSDDWAACAVELRSVITSLINVAWLVA